MRVVLTLVAGYEPKSLRVLSLDSMLSMKVWHCPSTPGSPNLLVNWLSYVYVHRSSGDFWRAVVIKRFSLT
jgi:hypothetical protein